MMSLFHLGVVLELDKKKMQQRLKSLQIFQFSFSMHSDLHQGIKLLLKQLDWIYLMGPIHHLKLKKISKISRVYP
jgi:hypothetical protein